MADRSDIKKHFEALDRLHGKSVTEQLFPEDQPGKFPEKYKPKPRDKKQSFSNKTADKLIDFAKEIGGQGYRINTTGLYDPKLKKYRFSGQIRGLPDVIIIFRGLFIGCEIKSKSDDLSDHQIDRKREIEKAGGIYFEVRDFEKFKIQLKAKLKQKLRK